MLRKFGILVEDKVATRRYRNHKHGNSIRDTNIAIQGIIAQAGDLSMDETVASIREAGCSPGNDRVKLLTNRG